MTEEDLVDKAFKLIGNLLSVADDTTMTVTKLMIDDFGLDSKKAADIVAVAFERWIKIYCPD